MVKKILAIFLIWRLFLFVPLFLSEYFLKFREGFNYTSTSYWSTISHFLVSPWANFDGVYYLIIAAGGYTVDNAGFFPLFPLLIGIFSLGSRTFSEWQFLVGLILPSALFLASLIVFNKLLALDYKKDIIIQSLIFLVLFPTSFFFATIYSESLFLILTLASFYFARKRNWFLASLFAGLLTATRIVGIAIIPALIYEFIKNEKSLFQKKALFLLLSPLGLISYIYLSFKQWGSPFQFISAQGSLQNERSVDQIVLLPQTIYRYFNIIFSVSPSIYEWWVALLELCSFLFVLVMLYIAWKKRIRFSYILFSTAAFLIPALTGTFSGMPRYILVLFPVFIVVALINNKYIRTLYIIVCLILLVILLALFSKGYYVS